VFGSLSALEHTRPASQAVYQMFVCTTLRRTSVQLSKPSDATHSTRPRGQPKQLTIREKLLGYHKFIATIYMPQLNSFNGLHLLYNFILSLLLLQCYCYSCCCCYYYCLIYYWTGQLLEILQIRPAVLQEQTFLYASN